MAVERQAVHAGRCPTLQSSRPRARVRSLAAAHRSVRRTYNHQSRRPGMKRILATLASLRILVLPSLALAGPQEDVSVATQTWIDGMNSHSAERVVALYDAEAVLWGT